MPFKSTKQKKWMWANKPDIAKRWTAEGKGYVSGGTRAKTRVSKRKGRR